MFPCTEEEEKGRFFAVQTRIVSLSMRLYVRVCVCACVGEKRKHSTWCGSLGQNVSIAVTCVRVYVQEREKKRGNAPNRIGQKGTALD